MYVGTLRSVDRGERRPPVRLGVRRDGARAARRVVKRGQVLATLDCRNASATSRPSPHASARARRAAGGARARGGARHELLDGGFVSPNEAEQKNAESAAEEAQLARRAGQADRQLARGERLHPARPVRRRGRHPLVDPGAFVRPGTAIVSVVDRDTVRMTADAPGERLRRVAPGTGRSTSSSTRRRTELPGPITRRAPAADPGTRTVHFEVDIADPTSASRSTRRARFRIESASRSPRRPFRSRPRR